MPGSSGNGRRETGAQPCGFIAWRATNGAPLRGCGADPGEPGPPVTGSGEKEREMKEAVITGAARTAAGSFLGSLADIPAPKLGAVAIAKAVSRGGIKKEEVDQVIMGNVLPAGVRRASPRQAGSLAGIPASAGAVTITKMSASAL